MSKYFVITILSVLLILLVLPQTASAGLVPCGRNCVKWENNVPGTKCIEAGEGVPLEESQPCNLCHVFKLLQRLTNGVGLLALGWAALFIVIGGIVILTATGTPERISQGKRMITYPIIGVVICFGAWIIINTVMNTLVNPEKMPWPWNKIQCVPTVPMPTDGGNNKICCYDLEGDNYSCHTYPSQSECEAETGCKADSESAGAFRFCCIDTQRRCSSTPDSTDKKYCVCETPVYDLDPNGFPSEASIIGTNAKVTSTLSSQQECLQKCVAANASTYCMASLKPQTAIYCASDTELKNKNACTLNSITTDCPISTQGFPKTNSSLATCINNSSCIDLVTPGSSVYNSTLAKRCWIDGTLLCRCENKGAAPNPCQLYRYNQEQSPGGTSLYDCNNASPYYCRLNCRYDKCVGGIPPGSCSGATCSDSNLDICGQTSNNCNIIPVSNWNSQIGAAAASHSICSGVDTIAFVKAIMARESGGNIKSKGYDEKGNPLAGGLMQLLPGTAELHKSKCGVTDTITFDWLAKSENAEKQICIAIEFMKSLVGSCGCSVRHIAAGYNGGGGKTGACEQSTNCGPAAKSENGECLMCSQETFTRRWECLWDDNKHTICNADRAASSFEATRRYVPQVSFCYDQF